ncbi:MAG TPA: prolipoprotein diacylglyceryl transferase [Methylomirabilota bacterium]|nr:prolipoprotein diacylglyceryl transferase [Methylomirabilota bacterium]
MFRSPGPIALSLRLPADLPLVGSLALTIRWYGVLIASAMALGLWLASREATRRGEQADELLKAAEFALVGGLIGARFYYVLFNLDYYQTQPWWRIFAVWEGGLAIHGGMIGGLLAGGGYVWSRGLPLLRYLDIVAPYLALGQAIGRWGNFFNEEAFGRPTGLPWKLYISESHRPPEFVDAEYFHPTFLYESLWNLGVFLVLVLALRRRFERAPGALFFGYLGLYSLGRFWIEGLRTDSLMFGSLRVAQLMSVIAVLAAAAIVPLLLRRHPRERG